MNTIPEQFRLKNTIKYPTSLLVGGVSALGFEIADALIEQGGYVIIVDTFTPENIEKLRAFPKDTLISFMDFSSIPHLHEDIRRLDYVFYFENNTINLEDKISTQEFLHASNTIDAVLSLAEQYKAKFLLATSIKAQQLIASNDDLNLSSMHKKSHIAYTQMELQRYAENLVQEYHERTELDTRIVRTAEMIGEHADFANDTSFNRLIMQAASESPLKLYKDGLESEWYIHTLDASYGIIKAQFSRGTTGNIYSIAYDHPITHLSIAYKIQELSETPPEIVFVDEKNNLPSLSFYKPAPNLSTIGWKPKVTFEKAVKQTLLAARVFILHSDKKNDSESGILKKLQSFINNDQSTTEDESAISRLIAERNRQEKLKKKRVELAHNATKSKRAYKPRTFQEKFQNFVWKQVRGLGEAFAVFKNRSPIEVLSMFLLLVIFVVLYIFILSPSIIIARNTVSLHTNVNNLEEALEKNDWKLARSEAESAKNNIESTQNALSFVEPVFNLLSIDEEFSEVKDILITYKSLANGTEEVLYYLEPLEEYLSLYEDNTQVRISEDTFISLENNGGNFEDFLLEMQSREPFLNSGIKKIEENKQLLPIAKSTIIPSYLRDKMFEQEQKFLNFSNQLSNYNSYVYTPTLLGGVDDQTYAIVLLDNSIPQPIGGEISSVLIITMANGSINNIEVLKPTSITISDEAKDALFIESLNMTRFNPLDESEITFSNLASIGDFSTFSYSIETVLEDFSGIEVENVVTLTFQDLESLLAITNESEVLSISNIDIINNQILDALSNQSESFSKEDKYIFSSQLASSFIATVSETWANSFVELVNFSGTSFTNGNTRASIQDDDISLFLQQEDPASIFDSDYLFKLYTSTINESVSAGESYISSQYDLRMVLNNEGEMTYSVKVQPEIVGSSMDVTLCVPRIISNLSLQTSGVQAIQRVYGSDTCIVVNITQEVALEFSWSAILNVEEETEFSLVVPATNSSTTNVDIEFSFDEQFSNVLVAPSITENNRTFVYSDTVFRNSLYTIVLENL